MPKTKIILDADVIIHFSKGEKLSILPQIFPQYDFVLLDVVHRELKGEIKHQIDNQIGILKNISLLSFNPVSEERKEYALLTKTRGRGESACLVYCRYNNDVIGSSNLKDIADYCQMYGITYLTTFDFLHFAVKKELISNVEANEFIQQVQKKGSKLPHINDFSEFISEVIL